MLLSIFSFICCSSKNSARSEEIRSKQSQDIPDSLVDEKLLALFFEMKDNPNTTILDSAVSLADSMADIYMDDERAHFKYVLQKIQFLVLGKQMDSAIDIIKRDNCSMWNKTGGPYFKDILKCRILAMSEMSKNNMHLYKTHIKEALQFVEKYITENRKEYISFLYNDLPHHKGKYYVTIQEYIYYSYLLYGEDEADRRLKEYQELYNIPENNIEQLKLLYKMDIMDFFPM